MFIVLSLIAITGKQDNVRHLSITPDMQNIYIYNSLNNKFIKTNILKKNNK